MLSDAAQRGPQPGPIGAGEQRVDLAGGLGGPPDDGPTGRPCLLLVRIPGCQSATASGALGLG